MFLSYRRRRNNRCVDAKMYWPLSPKLLELSSWFLSNGYMEPQLLCSLWVGTKDHENLHHGSAIMDHWLPLTIIITIIIIGLNHHYRWSSSPSPFFNDRHIHHHHGQSPATITIIDCHQSSPLFVITIIFYLHLCPRFKERLIPCIDIPYRCARNTRYAASKTYGPPLLLSKGNVPDTLGT